MAEQNSGDAIHIEQLEIFAHIGVPDQERASPQRLTLNLTAWPEKSFRDLNDDLTRTINYSAMARSVREFVADRRDKLIETLAEKIAAELLARFPIRRLRVELRKYVLPDTQFVSVILERGEN